MGCLGIGSVVAGSENATATEQAAQVNAGNVSATNQLNFSQYLMSRGLGGSSVLPTYLTNPNFVPGTAPSTPATGAQVTALAQQILAQSGGTLNLTAARALAEQQLTGGPQTQTEEQALGNNATAAYNAAGDNSPAAQIAQYTALANQFLPAQAQANTAANSIFNGNLQSEELQDYAPVASALQQGVTSQKEASIEGLQQTLNQIKAIQAGQGFSGDSFGTNLMTSNAIQAANVAQAQNQANVNVQNAGATNAIKTGILNTQLQNLNLPTSMAQSNINLANTAANAMTSQQGQGQQLFNMFRIGTGNFQYQNLPTVQPTPSLLGIAATAGNAVGANAGSYLATNPGNIFGGGASSAAGSSLNGINGSTPSFYTSQQPLSLSDGAASGIGINPSVVGESEAINSDVASASAGSGFGGN